MRFFGGCFTQLPLPYTDFTHGILLCCTLNIECRECTAWGLRLASGRQKLSVSLFDIILLGLFNGSSMCQVPF